MRDAKKYWGLLFTLLLVGCARAASTSLAEPSADAHKNVGTEVHLSAHGVGCISYEFPNKVGPPIYYVADIGKKDVPHLSVSDRKQIERIKKAFDGIRTLSFVVLRKHIVIYDADRGRCANPDVRYQVLNGRPNDFYQPGENAFSAASFMGTGATPYPWNR